MTSYFEQIRQHQREKLEQRKEQQAKAREEQERYLQSEDRKRDSWEAMERFWKRKAAHEGFKHTEQPFVSAQDRARMAEEKKQEEIAFLRERLSELESQEP